MRAYHIKGAFIVLASIFFLASCSTSSNPQLKEVEGLLERLEQMQNELSEIDAVAFDAYYKRAGELNSFLGPYFESLNKPSLKVYVDLANVKKAHRKSEVKLADFQKELDYSLQQLLILQRDIESGKINEVDAKKFISDETIVLDKLNQFFEGKKDRVKTLTERYKELMPKAEHLVDSINKTKS